MKIGKLVLCLVVTSGAFSGVALGATVGPATWSGGAESYTCISECGGENKVIGVNASTASILGSASNTLDLSIAPRISATSEARLPGGSSSATFFSTKSGSSIELNYAFGVKGPTAGAAVPVRIKSEGFAKIVGGNNTLGNNMGAGAALLIFSMEGPLGKEVLRRSAGVSATTGLPIGTMEQRFVVDEVFSLQSGLSYGVQMRAGVGTVIYTVPPPFSSIGDGFATAFVDPYFEIDPTFVSMGYSLDFSEGIRNTLTPETPVDPEVPAPIPLPASGVLLGFALMITTLLRRCRDRASAQGLSALA